MPTGSIEFLKLPGSLSSVEYPLLTSASESLTSYTVTKFSNVKYTLELAQWVQVPYFDNYDTCNCVRMNNEIYWIDAYQQPTLTGSSLNFHLVYNGPSSMLHKGDSATGMWERTGSTRYCDWLQYQPYSGGSVPSVYTQLPTINSDYSIADGWKYFFVSVTSTNDIPVAEYSTGSDAIDASSKDSLTQYFFIGKYGPSYSNSGIIFANGSYPSISTLINNPESLGFSASTITDISISERCPFPLTNDGAQPRGTLYITGADNAKITIGSYIYYKFSPDTIKYFEDESPSTISIPGTSIQQMISDATIVDENGAVIASIPYSTYINNKTLRVRCFVDFTGLYTVIEVVHTGSSSSTENESNYMYIVKPEGKLPWIGSTWEEYRAYSMAFDRTSVQLQTANNNTQAAANTITGVGNSILGGVIAGGIAGIGGGIASAGLNVLGNVMSVTANNNYLRNEQANLEKRTQAQPGTAYATQYGLNYVYRCTYNTSKIALNLPQGYIEDSNWASTYIEKYGYPDDLVLRSIAINGGYYKGKLTYTSGNTGLKFDATNSVLIDGLRFLEV